jgi:glycosyltransferase involved in cell wall biosynthesis
MVVVNMSSRDRTAEIAQEHGAQVITVPVIRRFDAARQVGLEALSTSWVMQLDADETAEGLVDTLHREGWLAKQQAIAVPKMNFIGDRWIKTNRWWPNHQIRIFPREAARYTATFHASLDVRAPVVRLPAEERYSIRHLGHPDARDVVRTTLKYLPDDPQMLSWRQLTTAVVRPLGAYVTSRAWRDGSDGVAILAARILNGLGMVTSREETTHEETK